MHIFTVFLTNIVKMSLLLHAGLGTVLAVDILNFPGLDLQHVANVLEWIFLTFIPGFCLGQGLNQFYENYEFLKICSDPMVTTGCAFNISNPCCKGEYMRLVQSNNSIRSIKDSIVITFSLWRIGA